MNHKTVGVSGVIISCNSAKSLQQIYFNRSELLCS